MAQGGRRTLWAEVTCEKHGKIDPDQLSKPKQVKVGVPGTKRERLAGCPQCAKEKVETA